MEEIENGVRITHEWLGFKQIIEATYEENRLELTILGKEPKPGQKVFLTEEETTYFLAWMATWYGLGE